MEKEARILTINEDQTSGTVELIEEPGNPIEFRSPVAIAVVPGELVFIVIETPSGQRRVKSIRVGNPA